MGDQNDEDVLCDLEQLPSLDNSLGEGRKVEYGQSRERVRFEGRECE